MRREIELKIILEVAKALGYDYHYENDLRKIRLLTPAGKIFCTENTKHTIIRLVHDLTRMVYTNADL